MFFDELANFEMYAQMDKRLMPAWDFLKEHPLDEIQDGRYELENGAYIVVKKMEPREEAPFEAHRRFADVQMVVCGSEIIEYVPLHYLSEGTEYSEEKDIQLFDDRPEQTAQLKLEAGAFGVFYPQDGHKPAMKWKHQRVRRMLIKIPL